MILLLFCGILSIFVEVAHTHSVGEGHSVLYKEHSSSDNIVTLYPSDALHFGRLWPIIRKDAEEGHLDSLIIERKQQIEAIKESWRPFIQEMSSENGPWHAHAEDFRRHLEMGKLVPCSQGSGGAYFLLDPLDNPRFVVKPFDEDILCLNNRKLQGSPFGDTRHRVRDSIDIYQSAQRETAAAATASLLHIDDITPWNMMAIVHSDVFYDLSEILDEEEGNAFIQRLGVPNKEKLCSIQPFITEAIDIGEAMHEWFEAGLEHSDTLFPLDQESYENANLLVWTIYDCDGHGGNFLLYLHSLNGEGGAIYGLKKIDNGLSFPSINHYLSNYLAYLPNAKLPLSDPFRKRIASIDSEAIASNLAFYGLDDCIPATLTRLSILKTLATRNAMTIEELNLRMEMLALPHGEQLALSECAKQELELLALEKSSSSPSLLTNYTQTH